jgi:hypothetical protein
MIRTFAQSSLIANPSRVTHTASAGMLHFTLTISRCRE